MPRTLFNEDGSSVEVPDAEEIQKLVDEKSALATKLEELGGEAGPDWKNLRREKKEIEDKLKKFESKAKEKGFSLEDEEKETLETEKIKKITQEEIRKRDLDDRMDEVLAEVPEDKRENVKHFFNKLSAGEEMTEEKFDTFVASSLQAVGIGREVEAPVVRRVTASVGGSGVPKFSTKPKKFGDTEQGKAFAARIGLRIAHTNEE